MSDLIDRNDDDYADFDLEAVLFPPIDGDLGAGFAGDAIARAGTSPVAAWRRLEQLREERFLKQCLREVYDD